MKKNKFEPWTAEKNALDAIQALKESDVDQNVKSQVIKAILGLQDVINKQKHIAIMMELALDCKTCLLKDKCINQKNGNIIGGCIADFSMLYSEGKFDEIIEEIFVTVAINVKN